MLQFIRTMLQPRCVLVELYGFYPTLFPETFAEVEQPELRQNYGGLEKRMALHRPQATDGANTGWGIALDLVAGERLSTVLDGQAVFLNLHGDLLSGKPLFGVEPEALEGEVAEVVEGASVASREERPGEVLFPVA